jgi:hypothetical protein
VSTINSQQRVAFGFYVDQYTTVKMDDAGSFEKFATTNKIQVLIRRETTDLIFMKP